MNTDIFFQKIKSYGYLTKESQDAWTAILRKNVYGKGDQFVRVGQIPRKAAFVCSGLFSQYYITDKGDTVIKYFFPEGRIAGSIPATLTNSESLFAIEALEETTVLEYDFREFKKLVLTYRDIADFYINYMERHWVIGKEPDEVSLRNDTAPIRYDQFLRNYPGLVHRLKKHHIASFLGIAPTQLSRILAVNK